MPLWGRPICLSSNKCAKLPHAQAARISSDEKKILYAKLLVLLILER